LGKISGQGPRLGTHRVAPNLPIGGGKVLKVSVQSQLLNRSPPLHRPIIFGNVRADLCGTRAFGA